MLKQTIIGFDMLSDEQSREFIDVITIGGSGFHVQEFRPIARNNNIYRKYAAISLENGAMFQVGYDSMQFYMVIEDAAVTAAYNRHVGQSGCMIICDKNGVVVSDPGGHKGQKIESIANADDSSTEKYIYRADIYNLPSYCMYVVSEGYYIIGVLPVQEALFSKTVSLYILSFLEIIVFGLLFLMIYFLIKRVVVNNIYKINSSLAQIAGGNLDVTVNVRSNEEFVSLSNDINSTVQTLKRYIAEAAARIDKELEYAKAIQLSALPSTFPPFPDQTDFDIYAQTIAAKEVGGDFYDFYMLDKDTVAFICADVSGKGIPAALFMMEAKTIIKAMAERGLPINDVFQHANQKLCEDNNSGMFVTAWMGILNIKTGKLEYVNAGHNPPLVLHGNGDFEYLKVRSGFVLAGMEGVKYKKHELTLSEGDRIFLYTDGITEATNNAEELYGEGRLLAFINRNKRMSANELLPSIKRRYRQFHQRSAAV
ncbi:MAG: SpoIIE family protein phosphatase [Clostridia bacterium]|nr:SpoIIE family protein phosphatase [Clostridia bacterium]MBQ4158175.1 SpoIIE family protein phosphatase [Clostridia bacterium]